MPEKDFLMGTLKRGGYLSTETGNILLTKITRQATQIPESAALKINRQDIGKTVLVKGELSGDVLYSAKIVEIMSPVTSMLVKGLIDKGIVSAAELQKLLSEIASKKTETTYVKRLCALVIGHKKSSPGAINSNSNITEFDFNEDLALRIEKKVEKSKIQRVYRRTYIELPDDINALGPDFIVSLHCNAFNKEVSGTEVLYYHRSKKGKRMAEVLLNHLVSHLKLRDRGTKPKTAEDRGGYLLRYTWAPCIIAEPFFIDNDNDLRRAQEDLDGLATAYAGAINEISRDMV